MNKKGYIYTLTAIVLILILVLFIAYYSRFTETEIEDVSGKMRCDELHFFVEDTKVDLERGLMITGRRGAIYAISNQIIGQSVVQPDYRFNCTPGCEHCSFFNYSGQGAEAAIAELMFCGTLYGRTNEYMLNHSLEKWLDKLEVHASAAGYSVSIMPTSFKLSPYDAFNLSSSLNLTVNISDTTELCYFSLYSVTIDFMTNVDGLEDPFYNDNTGRKVAKAVQDCKIGMHATEISEGSKGWGWVVGSPVLINNVSDTGKLASADKSKIIILNYDNFKPLLNGSYDTDLMNYGGIITNWDNLSVTDALDRIGIPYLAGASIYEITEDMWIILLASKYYFIDTDVNGICDSCVIYHENGTCLITQGNWFTSRSQTDSDGHYPIGFLFSEDPCKISPQLETDHTWSYNLDYPVEVKNVHLIASSYVTGDYNVTLTYFDGTNNISYPMNIRLSHRCRSEAENGTHYDSHYISKTGDATVGGVFREIFWNVTDATCGTGQTVEHITIKSSDISNDPLSGISITDPYNESPANDPVIWAITIEMAPMSVWKLNTGVENYTSSSLFMCYNISSNGPSFFDRVEGNLNTTDKYQSQTNNTIGLESFLSIERLHYYGVNVSFSSTAMDYLYFGDGETGYSLIGANESGIDYFRIDPNNAISYGVYDLINWNDYSLPTLGNCSSIGGYCQPTSGIECCGALVCFDYYYFDSTNFTCHNCLSPGQYCNISDTLYHTWCCSPKQCSAETHTCCAASETNCSDGLDNDCDGLRDCCDTECGSMPYCTAIESSNISFCNDTIDNNCNNLTDCADSTCKGVCPYCKFNATEVNCTNGIDEDCDTLIDCNDTLQCFGCPFCPKAENLNCTNGIDDNCNGLKDCCDSAACSCVLPQVCSNITCGCVTPGVEICSDNKDNDNDTKIDCQDTDCPSPCTACQNSTCSGSPTYDWICTNKCPGTNTSCGCNSSSCINCNTNGTGAGRTGDGCLGSSYIDYYCSGTSCTYTSDSCSDCSCTCGGYNVTESKANATTCSDGIDNDCRNGTDMADPKCETTPPSISGVQQDKPSAWTDASQVYQSIHTGNNNVNVRAIITDASGISSVKLYYAHAKPLPKPASRAGFSGPITMSLSGGYYQTVSAIPGNNKDDFWYYINATDTNGNWATSPTDSAPPNFWTYYCG